MSDNQQNEHFVRSASTQIRRIKSMQFSVDLNRQIKTSDLSSRDYEHFRSIMKKKMFSHNPSLIKRQINRQKQKIIQYDTTPKEDHKATYNTLYQTKSLTQLNNNVQNQYTPKIKQRLMQISKRELKDNHDSEIKYYDIDQIGYRNYKFQKPPLGLSPYNFIQSTYKLGEKLGIWDKESLSYKLKVNKTPDIIHHNDHYYKADHIERVCRPQGPQSCLETIYMSKLKEDQLNASQGVNQSNSNSILPLSKLTQQQLDEKQELRQKKLDQLQIQLLNESRSTIKINQYTQILNRWMKSNKDITQVVCNKEKINQFSLERHKLDKKINQNEKICEILYREKVYPQSLKILELRQQLFTDQSFSVQQFGESIQFSQIYQRLRLKNESIKQKYSDLIKNQILNKQELLLRTFIDKFQVFTHNDKLISQRLLISLGLPDPYINEEYMVSVVPYKIFERFFKVYVNKKADAKTKITTVLSVILFFLLDQDQVLRSSQFKTILRILCENLDDKEKNSDHKHIKFYKKLVDTFTISGVLNDGDEPIDIQQLKSIFYQKSLSINFFIDLINGVI